MYVSTNWKFGIGNATNVIKVLSIQSKICIWTKVVVSTWGSSHREWRILGGVVCPTFILQLLHHLQHKHRMKGLWGGVWNWHTLTHLHVCSGVLWTQMVTTKNTKPGSWRSSARYPQRPPPDVEDPTGPQLSTLLSFGERRLKTSHHTYSCLTRLSLSVSVNAGHWLTHQLLPVICVHAHTVKKKDFFNQ